MKYLLTIGLFVTLFTAVKLQSQTVKIDSVNAIYGDTILVPLEFYGYQNMGALTLFIEYDTLALEYIGMTNLIPEGQGTLTNATIVQDTITVVGIAWSANTGGIDFPDGKYMDLKFIFSSGESDLVFYEPMCEIVDWDVNPIVTTYIDGGIYHLTGVREINDANNKIYSDANKLILNLGEISNANIQIYDLLGRKVYNQELGTVKGNQVIHLSSLTSGYYIVKAIFDKEILTKKIYINQ